MSTAIINKKTAVSGRAPSTSQLEYGEIAINTVDGKLFFKYDPGAGDQIATITEVTSIDDLSDVDTSTTAPTTGQALVWDGAKWEPSTIAGSGSVSYAEQNIVSDTYTGDGSTTDFTVSLLPNSEDHVIVSINGIVQDPSTYSLLGSVVTLATAPALDDNVELRTIEGFVADVQINNYFSYVYTISSDTTSVTGADDNSNTLDYTPGRLEVYVNGVRLVNGSDFTATDGTSITFLQTVFLGSVVEVVSLSSATLLSQDAFEIASHSQPLTTTASDQVVAQFDRTVYRTAKFVVQMSHSSGYHSTEVLVVHDGTTAYSTEYGTIWTNASLGDISVGITGSNVELLVSPINTNTTVKAKRISVEV